MDMNTELSEAQSRAMMANGMLGSAWRPAVQKTPPKAVEPSQSLSPHEDAGLVELRARPNRVRVRSVRVRVRFSSTAIVTKHVLTSCYP